MQAGHLPRICQQRRQQRQVTPKRRQTRAVVAIRARQPRSQPEKRLPRVLRRGQGLRSRCRGRRCVFLKMWPVFDHVFTKERCVLGGFG